MISVSFSICCFIFLFILSLVYFKKNKVRTSTNRIFSLLILVNLLGLIIDIVGYFIFINKEFLLSIKLLISKIYLVYYFEWVYLIFVYVLFITNSKTKNMQKKEITILEYAMSFVIAIIILCLPIKLDNNSIYPEGLGIIFVYIIDAFMLLVIIIRIIKSKLNLKDKKYLPLFVLMIVGPIIMAIQKINPNITLLLTCHSIVTFVMYFTIENPDFVMLEEFRKNREYADATNREKEIFLFNLTQDIRKPLNNIGAACNELSMMTDNKEILKGVNYIDYNDRDALSIVNNVLDVNSMAASRIKVYDSIYNPKTLLENIARMAKSKIPNKVKFRVNIDKSIPDALYGDSIRIKQVIKILIDNACLHTKSGFIELQAHEITKNDICRLVISIEDSGKGILADQVNEIFSKQDEDMVIDESKENLITAKSISILLGGLLMCTSEIGRGTKFTFILDQKKDETKTKELEKIEEYIEKVTAIVVSEDASYLEKVTNKLIKNNIDAVGADLGAKAIEKVRKNPKYDYIILDEELEILNVDEVLTKLREIRDFESKVIIITKDIKSEKYLKRGFDGIISRKINFDDIDKLSNEQH